MTTRNLSPAKPGHNGWLLLAIAALLIAPPPPVWAWLDVPPWLNQNLRAFLGLQAIVAWSQLRHGRPGTDAVIPVVVICTIVGTTLLAMRPSWHYWPTLAAQAVLIVVIHLRARNVGRS